eukprot:5553955-Prymnesium_polylepis.1
MGKVARQRASTRRVRGGDAAAATGKCGIRVPSLSRRDACQGPREVPSREDVSASSRRRPAASERRRFQGQVALNPRSCALSASALTLSPSIAALTAAALATLALLLPPPLPSP